MTQEPVAHNEHEQIALSVRQNPFSQAFKEFIPQGWAPYPSTLPEPLPASTPAIARRAKLSAAFPGERLVLPAGPYRVRSNDCDYRFRPNTAFAYETGLGQDREPDAVLVLEPIAGSHEAILYFKPRTPRTDPEFYADSRYGEMWVGQRESLDEMSALTQLSVRPIEQLEEALREGLGTIPTRIVRNADESLTPKFDSWRAAAGLEKTSCEAADEEFAVWLSEARLIKDRFEVGEIRSACDRTAVAFESVVADFPQAIQHGRGERWVEGIFGLHARHLGNGIGYDSICAGGDHANTLHWIRNDGELRTGDLILVDAGVEVESLYTADITRTIPLNGKFTDAQRKVYLAVMDAQAAGFAAAKPGNKFKDVHQAAISVVARYLEEWGLLPVSAEEALSEEGGQHRRWMVHGTSHHLGIDVHDCAQARNENYKEAILQPGMVITVEPGIYFKSTDLLVPPELRGIGVRIEDDVVITEDGCRILSENIPRDPGEIESWMHWIWASTKN
ncbi:MAG: aminopeptidase P family protein [Propionibacteriaceae bacterium]|jgi:Xaa-Pro aminopeptidase|nr:aminopeptidase P family protein [Propionibacteriaceae bacterium]